MGGTHPKNPLHSLRAFAITKCKRANTVEREGTGRKEFCIQSQSATAHLNWILNLGKGEWGVGCGGM